MGSCTIGLCFGCCQGGIIVRCIIRLGTWPVFKEDIQKGAFGSNKENARGPPSHIFREGGAPGCSLYFSPLITPEKKGFPLPPFPLVLAFHLVFAPSKISPEWREASGPSQVELDISRNKYIISYALACSWWMGSWGGCYRSVGNFIYSGKYPR